MQIYKKIESKLFIQFLLLVTVPLMIMGIVSYNIYIKGEKLRNEIMLSNYSDVIKTEYESTFDNIRKYFIDFSVSDSYKWLQLQKSPPYYDYTKTSKAIKEINGGYAFNAYINNFNFINLEQGWVMDKNGMCTIDEIKNKSQMEMFISSINVEGPDVYWTNNSNYYSYYNDGIKKTNIINVTGEFLILKEQNIKNEITQILMIELDVNKLSNMAFKYRDMGYETIVLSDNKLLFTTDQMFYDAYYNNDFISADTIVDQNDRTFKTTKNSLIVSGMTYILGYDEALNSYGANIFIYIAITIIFTYFLLFVFLRLLVNYDLKPFKFLEERERKAKIHVEKQFGSNLIFGLADQEKINRIIHDIDLKKSAVYKLIVFSFKPKVEGEKDYEFINELINSIPEETRSRLFISPFKIDNKAVFIAGSGNFYLIEKKIATVYSDIKAVFEEQEDIIFSAGISDSFSKIIYAKEGYKQCIAVIDSLATDEKKENLAIDVYKEKNSIFNENAYDIIIENELLDLIDKCSGIDEIKKILTIIFKRVDSRCNFEFEKSFCTSKLNIAITNILIKNNIALHEVYNSQYEKIFEQVNELNDIEELVNYYEEKIIRPIINNLLQMENSNKDDLAINILKLISDSKGCITLNECAEQLNYSTTHLSKVLTQYKGSSFTDICNKEKIRFAKYMLLTTDYSINEISEKLEYNNVQNFIRFFKKQTEMTPLNFRKNMNKDIIK